MDDKKHKEIVGHVMFPVRVMMLDNDTSGYMPMLISDCVAEVSQTSDDGKKEFIGEVGGAMGGALHMRVGYNTFTVPIRDLWNGFVDFLHEHPDLAQNVNVNDLPRFDSEA